MCAAFWCRKSIGALPLQGADKVRESWVIYRRIDKGRNSKAQHDATITTHSASRKLLKSTWPQTHRAGLVLLCSLMSLWPRSMKPCHSFPSLSPNPHPVHNWKCVCLSCSYQRPSFAMKAKKSTVHSQILGYFWKSNSWNGIIRLDMVLTPPSSAFSSDRLNLHVSTFQFALP